MAVQKRYRSSGDDREWRRGEVMTITIAKSTLEADVIVARLRDGGIHATRGIKHRGNSGLFDDNSVYVLEEDLEMARHILAEDVEI